MIPGVSPAQAKQMMKKLGIKQEDLDAQQVIIKLGDKQLIFNNPSVSTITMSGQETFQLSGEYEEVAYEQNYSPTEEDVQTIVDQTGCSKEKATALLIQHKGDIASAIMELNNG